MWKLLRSVTPGNMTASLKIMPAYKLNVRDSGRVRCLLKRPQSEKKQKKQDLGVLALMHECLQPPCSHVLPSTGSLQRMAQVDPFFVSLCRDGCSC